MFVKPSKVSSPCLSPMFVLHGKPLQMSLVGTYHQKISAIRKQMSSLSERVTKLKKRTEKLHQKKVSEQLAAAEKKEKELERERQLTAKPAKELLQDQANAS